MGSGLVLNRRPKVPAEDSSAFGAIAERFRRAGALEQAVSLCREGLKKFPDHVSARVTLGWSLLDLGKYNEARLELEQVMRRAPDNLAAIRGMAELHDRFEHTLNLSMDGPGQWPPPAESMDAEPDSVHAVAFEAVADQPLVEHFENPAVFVQEPEFATNMTPPEMGLPLWTPGPAESAIAESLPLHTATTPGAGMSSVREIDAFAGAPLPVQAATAPSVEEAAPIEMGVQDLGVIDESLAALIAEAESLEAVADLQVVESASALESVETAAFPEAIELEAADLLSVELPSADVELVGLGASMPAAMDTFELDSAPEPVAMETVALAAESVPVLMEAVEPVVAAIELEATDLAVGPIELEATDLSVGPVAMEAVELEAEIAQASIEAEVAAPSVQADVQLDVQPIEAVTHTADVIAFASRPSPVAEVEQPLDDYEDDDIVARPVPVSRKGKAAIAALERMLARVHTRRTQLMAESVA